jgi:hypothetical protein
VIGVDAEMKDLSVLTPPLLVCAAFLFAVGAFLRHEMAAGRRRPKQVRPEDISEDDLEPDSEASPSGRPERTDDV